RNDASADGLQDAVGPDRVEGEVLLQELGQSRLAHPRGEGLARGRTGGGMPQIFDRRDPGQLPRTCNFRTVLELTEPGLFSATVSARGTHRTGPRYASNSSRDRFDGLRWERFHATCSIRPRSCP